MKITSYALLCVLGTSLLLAGCAKPKTIVVSTPQEEAATAMKGSAMIDNGDTETKVTYTFKNQSKETITVIGGAAYTLLKNHAVIDKGAVPIKDYLDLEPGQSYTDSKTFTNLTKGDYQIEIVWNKTKVTIGFSRV